jgi:hypothetical protein
MVQQLTYPSSDVELIGIQLHAVSPKQLFDELRQTIMAS